MQYGAPALTTDPDLFFSGRVVPELGVDGPPIDQPRFVVVGGQQGAGKSSLTFPHLVVQSTQFVLMDVLDSYAAEALPSGPGDRGSLVDARVELSNKWTWALMKRALKLRQNVVFELAYPGIAKPFAEIARKQGYATELAVLSVNRFVSFASTVDRQGREADSVIISFREHQQAYDAWLGYVVEAENRGYFDEVRVVSRDRPVYSNHLVLRSGTVAWDSAPDAFGALAVSRYDNLSLEQIDWLRSIWQGMGDEYQRAAFESAAQYAIEQRRAIDFTANGPWAVEFDAWRQGSLPMSVAALVADDVRRAHVAANDMDAPNYGDLAADLLHRLKVT